MISIKTNKIYSLLIFILLLTHSINCYSQELTAYLDYRGYLYAFDRGFSRQIEYLRPLSYKIGGNSIAYIDNKNDFKIYYDGQTFPLVNAADFGYYVSDNLTAFSVGDLRVGAVLYAFDEGQKKTLCYYATYLNLNDSLLVYFDGAKSSLLVYYNGSVANLEDALLSNPKAIKTGPNIVAWINQSNIFTVFYHGETFPLDDRPPLAFSAGRDIIAYVDDYERKFRLFYKGDTAMVDEFIPDSFKVGFGIMGYVNSVGNFYIFDEGATKKILSDRPDFFFVKGNVIVYSYNNTFNIYYKGTITTLQTRAPADFQLGNNGIAWIDDSGRLMLFDKGKTYTVSYETINKYYLNGNVLKYEVGVNTVGVFYNGKNY